MDRRANRQTVPVDGKWTDVQTDRPFRLGPFFWFRIPDENFRNELLKVDNVIENNPNIKQITAELLMYSDFRSEFRTKIRNVGIRNVQLSIDVCFLY